MTKPKYSPEERRQRRAANLARNVAKLSREKRSERSRKAIRTRKKRELYLAGDTDNSLGERFDFAFDAFDPNTGIMPREVTARILAAASSQDVTLVIRVASLNTDTDERSEITEILVFVPMGTNDEKTLRGLIYAALRAHASESGPGGKSDPHTALLLRGVKFAADY